MEKPFFTPMKVGLEYCVLVKWGTGASSRVNYFACEQDAQRWIDRESENWLLNRASWRFGQKFVVDRATVALRGPRIRTSLST
jgi:hypothetical protein